MRILALTPIKDEYDALTSSLHRLGFVSYGRSTGRLPFLSYLGGSLVVAQGGLGKAQFGIQAQHAIDTWSSAPGPREA